MSELVNLSQLAKQFGVTDTAILATLKAGGLEPRYTIPYGMGTMRMYDPDEAAKAWEAAKAAAAPVAPSGDVTAFVSCVSSMNDRIIAMQAVVGNMRGDLVTLAKKNTDFAPDIALAVETITKQNRALLAAIESVGRNMEAAVDKAVATLIKNLSTLPGAVVGHLGGRLDKLEAAVMAVEKAPTLDVAVVPPAPNIPPKTVAPFVPKKVTIIGLIPMQRAAIEREFGVFFSLRIFQLGESTESSIVSAVQGSDVVFCLTTVTANLKLKNALKACGQRVVYISSGGVATLRERLKELYAGQKVAA